MQTLTIRALTISDIPLIGNYWQSRTHTDLDRMGADASKLPTSSDFQQMMLQQLNLPLNLKNAFCVIWELNGRPCGHSNTNPTTFGDEAKFHLHIWDKKDRATGNGKRFLKQTIPYFFEHLQLNTLIAEPKASNAAPNNVLRELGFTKTKTYETEPGSINLLQIVNRWELKKEKFHQLLKSSK